MSAKDSILNLATRSADLFLYLWGWGESGAYGLPVVVSRLRCLGPLNTQGKFRKVVRVYSFSVLPVLPCYLVIIIELFGNINHVQDVTVLPFVFNI